jgi:hypothetical protein
LRTWPSLSVVRSNRLMASAALTGSSYWRKAKPYDKSPKPLRTFYAYLFHTTEDPSIRTRDLLLRSVARCNWRIAPHEAKRSRTCSTLRSRPHTIKRRGDSLVNALSDAPIAGSVGFIIAPQSLADAAAETAFSIRTDLVVLLGRVFLRGHLLPKQGSYILLHLQNKVHYLQFPGQLWHGNVSKQVFGLEHH